jgi:hypothetical protein
MPEFILDHGTPAAAREFTSLDAFTQGYIEAMFFTSTGPDDDIKSATVADLHPDTLKSIIFECAEFQEANRADIDEATDNGRINGYDDAAAGRDFWYSRNGHGVGYFDRDIGDVGAKLQNAAYQACESTLYLGDDNFLHLD